MLDWVSASTQVYEVGIGKEKMLSEHLDYLR